MPWQSLRRARLLAVAWAVFLFALTSWPSPPDVPVVSAIPNFDKVVHATLYGVEGFLLYFCVAWPGPRRFSWLAALVIGGALAVWGTADELHQAWIPGRSMEAGDAMTDAVAGFGGAVIASAVAAKKGRGESGGVRGSWEQPPSLRS
jgi:VanZ family protein